MKRIVCLVLLLLLCHPGASNAAKRVALVIGNGGYADSPLRNPVNDAKDMAAKLRGLGFDVTLLTDAGQRKMEDAIYAFDRKLGSAALRLFYYAGHGMQVSGANYLIPVDASVRAEHDIKYEAVHAGRVLDGMAAAGPGVNILVLDACRNNPFARSFRSSSRGLARMDAPSGSMIVYATSPGDVAADGNGRNGIFTKNLLDNIDRKGLTLEQVFKRTGRGVMRDTNGGQVPWTTSSVFDDVYLSGKIMVADGSTYAPPVSQSPQKGSLRIESQPSGAQVFLNGNRVGPTPKTLDGLNPGQVTVRVEKPGYQPMEQQAHVMAGDSLLVAFPLSKIKPGRLYVLAKPSGSTVRILNISPRYFEGMSLAPGRYHLEVSKSGYRTVRQWVELTAGQDLDVPVTLERTAVAESSSPSPGNGDETLEGQLVPLPVFLVNLADTSARRYLKLGIEIEVRDSKVTTAVIKYQNKIKDAMIVLLSSKTYNGLATMKSKIELKQQMADRLNQILGKGSVLRVYITEMVIQ